MHLLWQKLILSIKMKEEFVLQAKTQVLSIFDHDISCADPERGKGSPDPPPLKNHKKYRVS